MLLFQFLFFLGKQIITVCKVMLFDYLCLKEVQKQKKYGKEN